MKLGITPVGGVPAGIRHESNPAANMIVIVYFQYFCKCGWVNLMTRGNSVETARSGKREREGLSRRRKTAK
jgi:hypothetical protein